MNLKPFLYTAVVGLATSIGTVQADETFATLADVSPVKLTSEQMAQVRGANHVIRLVLQRTGKESMPTEAAAAATDRAGSIDGAGNDRPAIVRLLN